MSYKNGNYAAFYVDEPVCETNLKPHSAKDFVYYNMIRAWKGKDSKFPFVDSHDKNYNVRDDSDWEKTLKPRLRDRLNNSKNIVLFLSERTVNSRALREEIDYGINTLGLPVIVIYPDYDSKESLLDSKGLKDDIKKLWNNLPIFRDSKNNVPTLHIPFKKDLIIKALSNDDLMINSKGKISTYYYRA
ncbi:TIR domain-containing protein [Xenorhabdus bovienii]|uniref:TIR domain-containing protein n=1 Tax=Xenorhabdus bovienii TaxID=40576 RepID=UPI0004D94FAC|nr:TIR domain-containing protein [Xenorhabdus bovienii]CDG89551.1 conserved hypothetical protein [Xenorhabdus bovienii str. feltiae France]CDG92167.1 conserved hypothetical protein [Xenorhabdus bovienii str. feltiae Florida]